MFKKHKFFLAVVLFEIVFIFCLFIHSNLTVAINTETIAHKRGLVKELKLTDFSIWTEARYTRHPSQADFFSAFQDFPASIEHFPAGSIVNPPEHE